MKIRFEGTDNQTSAESRKVDTNTGYKRLGAILVEKGFALEEDIAHALTLQKTSSARLGEIVASMGWASESEVTQCLAEQYGYETVDPLTTVCDPAALALLNDQRALRNLILPVGAKDGHLHCIIGDPINVVPIDELRSAQSLPLNISMAPPSELRDAIIQQYFKHGGKKPRKITVRKHKIDSQVDRIALLRALDYENDRQGNKRFA